MSTANQVTVYPGALIRFGQNDKRMLPFDFDAKNLAVGVTLVNTGPSFGITITPIKQNGSGALTFDSGALAPGSRIVTARFIASAAALGDSYRVSVVGKTSESPEQDKEYSVTVLIQGS